METTIYDAITETVRAIGGFKATSARLWPAMNLASAYARLKHCSNESHREKLAPDELALLAEWGAAAGCFAIAEYMSYRSGGAFTFTIKKDDHTELRTRLAAATANIAAISAALLK